MGVVGSGELWSLLCAHPPPRPPAQASCTVCPPIPLPGIVSIQEEVLSGLGRKLSSHKGSQSPLQHQTSWPPSAPSHWSPQGTRADEGAQATEPQETPIPSRGPLHGRLGELPSLTPLVSWGIAALSQGWAGSFVTPVGYSTQLWCWRTSGPGCEPEPCPPGPCPASVGLRDGGSQAAHGRLIDNPSEGGNCCSSPSGFRSPAGP